MLSLVGVVIILPIIAAIIGFIIGAAFFIGICLLIIGCTGVGMNKIYSKQMEIENSGVSRFYNITSIILGLLFILFPLGYVLYRIIHSLSS